MKKIIPIILIIAAFLFYRVNLLGSGDESNNMVSGEKSVKQSSQKDSSPEREFSKPDVNRFKDIKIGDRAEKVEQLIGEPSRIDKSEYTFDWYVYNQYGEKFAMVGIENDEVVALFSNSINSCEMEDILLNNDRSFVRGKYTPITFKQKGNTRFMINSKDEYDILKKNNNYITVFYDLHEENRVCSYLVISKNTEEHLNGIYPKPSDELQKSYELEMIDLVNSVRLQKGLNSLEYSKNATESSRKHSYDMMSNNFFNHVNKAGQTPFYRMEKEGIVYSTAGENIAAGQVNSIYAHEALMNSLGHRKNILGEYNNIGIGVKFGGEYKTYYTQNFYSGI